MTTIVFVTGPLLVLIITRLIMPRCYEIKPLRSRRHRGGSTDEPGRKRKDLTPRPALHHGVSHRFEAEGGGHGEKFSALSPMTDIKTFVTALAGHVAGRLRGLGDDVKS